MVPAHMSERGPRPFGSPFASCQSTCSLASLHADATVNQASRELQRTAFLLFRCAAFFLCPKAGAGKCVTDVKQKTEYMLYLFRWCNRFASARGSPVQDDAVNSGQIASEAVWPSKAKRPFRCAKDYDLTAKKINKVIKAK
jgi:hypothetical protein